MAVISGDQLRGHLEGLILAAPNAARRTVGTFGGNWKRPVAAPALKEGSLYPALYRLEQQGLIAARWEAATAERRGPRRRVYRLTAKGRRRLHAARDEWRQFVTVLGGLLGAPA